MGTIRKREKKKRGKTKKYSYRAEVSLKGYRDSKTFDDKADAELWIRDKENAIRNGTPLPGEVARGDMLLYTAMERYILESRTLVSKSQIKSYENSELMYRRTFAQKTTMALD